MRATTFRAINQTVSAFFGDANSWIQLNRNFGKFRGKWKPARVALYTYRAMVASVCQLYGKWLTTRGTGSNFRHIQRLHVRPSDPRHARRFSDTPSSFLSFASPEISPFFFCRPRRNDMWRRWAYVTRTGAREKCCPSSSLWQSLRRKRLSPR